MKNFSIHNLLAAVAALSISLSLGNVDASEKVETFLINKKEFQFALPSGYCKLGTSARERAFEDNINKYTNGVGTTLFLAADCEDMLSFLRAEKENLSGFFTIQTVQQNGKPVTVKESRKEFIKVNVDYLRKEGLGELASDLNELSTQDGLKLKEAETRLIGEDSSAFYLMARFDVSGPSKELETIVVQGSTLVKSHVLSVNVYSLANSNSPKKRMLDTSKQVVNSLIEQSK